MRILTGNANCELAADIAAHLGIPLSDVEVGRFSDGEIRVKINESMRGADVFVVQPTCPPSSENIMELLIIIDALKRASPRRIVAVIPYYGYARQEKKASGREPITARLMADLLTVAGANRILALDMHVPSIQGFFNLPVDHLNAGPLLAEYWAAHGFADANTVVVSPDVGGVGTARAVADHLQASLAIIAKRRPQPNQAEAMEVIGDLNGKRAIFFDDMIDTARSLVHGAKAVAERGAAEIYACATHGIFSEDAISRIGGSLIRQVVVTDTIPLPAERRIDKIHVLSVAPLLAEAIRRVHEDASVSSLFDRLWIEDKR
ncbi:MAG: ribose-phosphate pyrophosphokinase [Armatimonadota bacterium]|nr:MAG: ribose-phosphate pyrophosphokinase [Armatimonadota bacterium]